MRKNKPKRRAIAAISSGFGLHVQAVSKVAHRALEFMPDDEDIRSFAIAARQRDVPQMVKLADSMDMQMHSSCVSHAVKSQLSALVKKYPYTPDELAGFDPQEAAWKKFQAAEHRCKRVNQRSTALRYGAGFRYSEIISEMKRYIRSVIGSHPDLNQVYDRCWWGPGASVGVSGDFTNFARKFLTKDWSVTRLALPYAIRALWGVPQLSHLLCERKEGIACLDYEYFRSQVMDRIRLVTHNNIAFVPKTYKTFRSIASEPLLNGFVQKGIDEYMRFCLKTRAGIDLTDQEQNKLMARQGSIDNGVNPYCTIDLSSASDSISYAVPRMLLPSAWFRLLDDLRSHQYKYRGECYTYHKFVSMGNGFCFPLQTLIFAAVCHACSVTAGHTIDFRVYGDDIIVRRETALLVLEVLKYLGFRSNPDKTFLFGPFRESCGADWYSGQDVRPVYVDRRISTNVDMYTIHNSLRRSSLCDVVLQPYRKALISACPPDVRFLRPYEGNSDSAFEVDLDMAMSSKELQWKRAYQNWSWLEVSNTPVRDRLREYDPLICNLLEYVAVLRGSSSRVPLAVRRKTKASVRRMSYWGPPVHDCSGSRQLLRPRKGAEQ